MYENMKTLTEDDWNTEGKWEEYKFMIESVNCVTSQMKEDKEEQITDTMDGKKEAEW